ncbi:aldehyde dehydrogenase family protein [Salicibibacter halophilus]|uniref:Aldehyde dehydrogenase family protein n=1 Tax=Salicibibacter halophilus TaxID=2502791 RepID=A0A514LM01_9BACI|nr:aldehyde dehydrogenase family protein [Salicibibacter halophilus]
MKISLPKCEKVQSHVDDAIVKGGHVLAGGNSFEKNRGQYFEPTIVTEASDDMLCMNEETFGPVAPVASFQTEEEVIERANNSPFGLAAYVFSENIGKAVRVSEALEYGIVGVNDGLPSVPQAPFGGMKESGLGREGGQHGIEEYLEVKYISLGV